MVPVPPIEHVRCAKEPCGSAGSDSFVPPKMLVPQNQLVAPTELEFESGVTVEMLGEKK